MMVPTKTLGRLLFESWRGKSKPNILRLQSRWWLITTEHIMRISYDLCTSRLFKFSLRRHICQRWIRKKPFGPSSRCSSSSTLLDKSEKFALPLTLQTSYKRSVMISRASTPIKSFSCRIGQIYKKHCCKAALLHHNEPSSRRPTISIFHIFH